MHRNNCKLLLFELLYELGVKYRRSFDAFGQLLQDMLNFYGLLHTEERNFFSPCKLTEFEH